MPSVAHMHARPSDHPLYSKADLIGLRRTMLLYCRSFPPGNERDRHRHVAQSLTGLFRNKVWMDAHVLSPDA
jgi:hypothetical protein